MAAPKKSNGDFFIGGDVTKQWMRIIGAWLQCPALVSLKAHAGETGSLVFRAHLSGHTMCPFTNVGCGMVRVEEA